MRALLHAEWTKFRTVRGWTVAVLVGAFLIIGFGLLPGHQGSCGQNGPASACALPVGPNGQEVTDQYYFAHRTLTGDGTITVRLTSLTGRTTDHSPTSMLVPWAKAGLLITGDLKPGAAYAAIMETGAHGVRMQTDYTHDHAGPAATGGPWWLRLSRTGDIITGAASTDGQQWTTVATARLTGLPADVRVGLFTTSPQFARTVGVAGIEGGPTIATGVFDHLTPAGALTGTMVGGYDNGGTGRLAVDGDTFTVDGSGDIAPAVPGAAGLGTTITQTLVGTFIGLILLVVVGTMFITAEYRRGLIRTTLAAGVHRGRMLAAKALVLGAVTFATGLVAATVVVTLGQRALRANGAYVHPATTGTELRVIIGTAALLAVSSVLGLAIGTVLRRGATAVTAVITLTVLPYLLAMTVLPAGPANWLLRVTPAAGFAIQQTAPRFSQVDNVYNPPDGYFPLPPWAGFGVLCAWTAVMFGFAVLLLRRRDV